MEQAGFLEAVMDWPRAWRAALRVFRSTLAIQPKLWGWYLEETKASGWSGRPGGCTGIC